MSGRPNSWRDITGIGYAPSSLGKVRDLMQIANLLLALELRLRQCQHRAARAKLRVMVGIQRLNFSLRLRSFGLEVRTEGLNVMVEVGYEGTL